MTVTKRTVAEKIVPYLRHDISLADLVSWAEDAMTDGEFDENEAATIFGVVSRLGVADVRAFGFAHDRQFDLLWRRTQRYLN
jgi:hypothetical protein